MCLRAMGSVCCVREGSPMRGASQESLPIRAEGSESFRVEQLKNTVSSWFMETHRREVMGKYWMHTDELSLMGEGTSGVCRKGTVMGTREAVAIKVYKPEAGDSKVQLQKFRRQISVLRMLQEPLKPPDDSTLWCDSLAHTLPSRIFMQLIDYSKDAEGNPGPDPKDGQMYAVTELASYSLKDYLKMRKDECRPLSIETVRTLARAIMLVTAGLHAKGLVHLDLKPENLMIFGGKLKLIDVDGCVEIGTRISITDSSLSFSPCYCAPEWALFVIEDHEAPTIVAAPGLDVWSIGMTICELVSMTPVLKNTYASFMRHGRNHQQAAFLFMEWLSSVKKAPMPKSLHKFDSEDLIDLLSGWLLVPSQAGRRSLAASLSHSFVRHADLSRAKTGPLTESGELTGSEELPDEAPRQHKKREEDHSSEVVHKCMLWKLNDGGDPQDPAQWLRRDMWIAANGSLCYFSLKEDKRLVLLDSHLFSTSTLSPCPKAFRQPAFTLHTHAEHDHHDEHALDEHSFACESEEDYSAWVRAYGLLKSQMERTVRLGPEMAQKLQNFRLSVNNRRKKVGLTSKEHTPAFKAPLWKCKANGEPKKAEHWFEREMWLSANGSLVYFSKREDRELVHYTHEDLEGCSVDAFPDGEGAKPWAFKVLVVGSGDMEFAPGVFAAESEEMRRTWMEEIRKLKARKNSAANILF